MSWDRLPAFHPSPIFSGGHLQTVFSHLLKVPQIQVEFERWIIPVEGGDELWCRFYAGHTREFAVLFHGLGGSADSTYMQICGKALIDDGHSVLLVNHRGAGEGADHAAGIYHSGAIGDVAAVLAFARARKPDPRLTAVGYSLSANLLLNAGALLTRDLPDRIVSVNPPVDLHVTAGRLLHPSNLIYDQKFVLDLKRFMRHKFVKGKIPSLPRLPLLCRLPDFDAVVTAPLAGFASRDEYYTRCSSVHHAERIQPPTLILSTEDDPFIPPEPLKRAAYRDHVHVRIEKFGGHVGFLGRDGRWLGDFIRAAVAAR